MNPSRDAEYANFGSSAQGVPALEHPATQQVQNSNTQSSEGVIYPAAYHRKPLITIPTDISEPPNTTRYPNVSPVQTQGFNPALRGYSYPGMGSNGQHTHCNGMTESHANIPHDSGATNGNYSSANGSLGAGMEQYYSPSGGSWGQSNVTGGGYSGS